MQPKASSASQPPTAKSANRTASRLLEEIYARAETNRFRQRMDRRGQIVEVGGGRIDVAPIGIERRSDGADVVRQQVQVLSALIEAIGEADERLANDWNLERHRVAQPVHA